MNTTRRIPSKAAASLVAALAFATLFLAGCGSSATGSGGTSANAPSSASPTFEKIAVSSGSNMVSDDVHIFFTDGVGNLYRTDLDLSSVVMLDRVKDGEISALCLHDGKIYYAVRTSSGSEGGTTPGYAIHCVDTQGNNIAVIGSTRGKVESLVFWHDNLIYVDDGALAVVSPGKDTYDSLKYKDTKIQSLQATEDGLYFTATDGNGKSAKLVLMSGDLSNPNVSEVADIGSTNTFAIVDADYYYLAKPEQQGTDEDSLNLIKLDAQGNVTPTGVSGIFSNTSMYESTPAKLCASGNCIFYSKHETTENSTWQWIPYCYDTATGQETQLAGYDGSKKPLAAVSDVCSGYVFLRDYSTGIADGNWMLNLLDAQYFEKLATIVDGADDSIVTKRENAAKAEAEAAAAAEAAKAEELANEPYGPETSELHLSASDKSACFRLVRMDGSTEFMVLLSPGESSVQTFPSGRYTLKTAEGDTWISDTEAFGPKGSYSTTDVFTFEPWAAYEISTGERGDFRGDSASGFVG